jgi:hypothetical protein
LDLMAAMVRAKASTSLTTHESSLAREGAAAAPGDE